MKRYRVLIVDDEPLAREGIRTRLLQDPEIRIVGECANGRDAVAAIRKHAPDLVFLDVQMPLLDGFGVVEAIGVGQMPVVIFVTAYDEYALRAFEAHALDYLLKPVKDERLANALSRAKRQVDREIERPLSEQLVTLLRNSESEPQSSTQRQQYLDRITVKARERIFFLDVKDIDWVGSVDNYVQLHAEGKSHMIRETMNSMESKLNPAQFVRIRRSTIVNIRQVKELRPLFNGEYLIILEGGTRLQSSRRYRKNLHAFLQV